MIKPFEYFIKENLVAKSAKNPAMAEALMQKAEIRLKRIISSKIEEAEASIVLEDIYESLREASQAIMELEGYKPYSHEALVAFINEYKILSDGDASVLDSFRILRNNSVYKAEKISLPRCRQALEFAKSVLPELRKKFSELNTNY